MTLINIEFMKNKSYKFCFNCDQFFQDLKGTTG